NGTYYFPGVEITDAPRFPWRGLLIDVCLHWMPMDVILRTLDLMASVKMNVLHLHLSEDQMFGIESKIFPRLTQLGAEGNFFTQEEMKKIIAAADQRGIRIVPEFDVPGHCTAMLRAYPELAAIPRDYPLQRYFGIFDPALDVTKPYTYEFLDKLFGEMAALFPDEYFHIGGDENTGEDWKRSPGISAYMRERGMKDYRELQTEFMQKLLPIVQKHGKKMMGWDEIYFPGIPKEIMIHSWRGRESLVDGAKKGYQGLLSTGYYIDLIQPTDFHYLNDPLPEEAGLTPEQQRLIVGGEATMWTEHVTPETVDSRIWPRTAAIAERLWSDRSVRDVEDMYRRLDRISILLEGLGSTHLRNKQVLLRRLADGGDVQALETLVEVIEPLKIYQRNAGDTLYNVFSPYTKLADVATPDQTVARHFRKDVAKWLAAPDAATAARIRGWLMRWRDNHVPFMELVKKNPVLEEAAGLSENLSRLAVIGLEAMDLRTRKKSPDKKWRERSLEVIKASREQGGRCDLQVVEAVAALAGG
ncbi:MAG: family 20 glycosylhydrolase, partial [Bacteroidota bacterium]